MRNEIQQFEHNEFGSIRVIEIDGQPWFVGGDVAAALGYENTRDALIRHVDSEDKNTVAFHDGIRGNPNKTVINESGLYSLILSSKLAAAKKFKRWVTKDVLPSIRKHGLYITDSMLDSLAADPALALKIFQKLLAERDRGDALAARVLELAPKARYCDTILLCKETVQTTLIAKDYGFSTVAFNRLLHKLGVQFRLGPTWVLYQEYASQGYTQTRTYYTHGGTAVPHTTWTQKGRLFLYEFLRERCILPKIETQARH